MRFPHGGVEVGGILLGTRSGDVVRVVEVRPLEIDYANGASFVLTPSDEEALEALTESSGPLEVVGWYESHTRRDFGLSEADLAIYNQHFSRAGQVCMVVKPVIGDASSVVMYSRDDSGTIVQATVCAEIEGEAWERPHEHAAATAAGVDAAVPDEPIAVSAAPAKSYLQPLEEQRRPPVVPINSAARRAFAPEDRPARRRRSALWYAAAAIVAVLCAGLAWLMWPVPQPAPVVAAPVNATPTDQGTRSRTVPPPVAAAAPDVDSAAAAQPALSKKPHRTVKHSSRRARARRR